jgi:pimeloyl-ACP methyl ester carboxylesterase
MEQVQTDPRVRYTDMVACTRCDLREGIGRIDRPALILAGADDPITTPDDAELVHGRIRSSRLCVIADAAHHLPNEQPGETNSAIESFLAEL